MSWPMIKFSEVVSDSGVFSDGDWVESKDQDPEGDVRLIQLADVGVGHFVDKSNRFMTSGAASKLRCTFLEAGDILIARMPDPIGRACIFPKNMGKCVTVVDVCIVRPNSRDINNRWLMHLINSEKFRSQISQHVTGTTRQRISRGNLTNLEIPLPPLAEQKRIAAILDKADVIRRKRQQAIQLADEFLRAVFLDMFGDPVTNPKGWETERLGNLTKVVSGATPSKGNEDFWNGDFPWVSPKDMKTIEIRDSIDRISQVAFEQTNLKKLPVGSVLIVVRGMILAHTVPIGITAAQVAINQDIKAFLSRGRVLPEFLLWFLLSQHSNLLSKVSNAAHGTKRFDMDDLLNLPVFVPDLEVQDKFVGIARSYKNAIEAINSSHSSSLTVFKSLSQKAFAGEL